MIKRQQYLNPVM